MATASFFSDSELFCRCGFKIHSRLVYLFCEKLFKRAVFELDI
ncbi:hypothetical protein LEP1GSC039_0206 [Leptospira santarosai str. 2000027870]|nr:hypothetical protein LEP1GSC039_0206 [Leptospira santarosai str. 2000027870]